MARKKKPKLNKDRNPIIAAAFNRECNLSTIIFKDKKKYSRKSKHKYN